MFDCAHRWRCGSRSRQFTDGFQVEAGIPQSLNFLSAREDLSSDRFRLTMADRLNSCRSCPWRTDPQAGKCLMKLRARRADRVARACRAAPRSLRLVPAEPRFERIFGPEVKTGPYKHPACMTELSNGDFYLVYYGGAGRVRGGHRRLRIAAAEGFEGVVAPAADRPRPVPLGRQRRGLGSPRRRRLALLRGPLRRHLVDLAGSGQGLARPGRDLVGRVDARARRGNAGAQPADRAREWRLPPAALPRDRPRHRDDRPGQLFVLPPLLGQGQDAGPRPGRSARPGGTSSRRSPSFPIATWSPTAGAGGLPAGDHRLHRPFRVARRRLDLERGQRLGVPQPQRRGRPAQAARTAICYWSTTTA